MLVGGLLYAGDDRREVVVVDGRQDDTEVVGPSLREASSVEVGFVPEFGGFLNDLLARLGTDVIRVSQGPRDGGHGDV